MFGTGNCSVQDFSTRRADALLGRNDKDRFYFQRSFGSLRSLKMTESGSPFDTRGNTARPQDDIKTYPVTLSGAAKAKLSRVVERVLRVCVLANKRPPFHAFTLFKGEGGMSRFCGA